MTPERKKISAAYKDLANTEFGKTIINDLDSRCLYKGNIYDPLSERKTTFNLGKNAVIRYIHQEIDRNESEESTKVKHEEVL